MPLKTGLNFWLENFFLADGTPKYYDTNIYPVDIHSASAAIVALCELNQIDNRCLPQAEKTLRWTIENMRDEQGFFYYQKKKNKTVKIPSSVGRRRGRLTRWRVFSKQKIKKFKLKSFRRIYHLPFTNYHLLSMRIWIDLGNSPHVPFFGALAKEFERRGHTVLWTARDYAQTVELARTAGIDAKVFGTHGGKSVFQKGGKFIGRTWDLLRWARGKKIDLVVVHNSQEPLVVARILHIKSVTLMDYEHHPGNHLSFRTAKKVIVPESFPEEFLRKFGVSEKKVRRFRGIKEDVYLSDFEPDEEFSNRTRKTRHIA